MPISGTPDRDTVLRLADGRAIGVAEWGPVDGRPVFELHGNPGSRLLAPDPAITRARGVRLVAPERPGYGVSDPTPGHTVVDVANDVVGVADELGLGRIRIVGISGGCPYAMAIAARYPERVDRLAIQGADSPPDENPEAWTAYSERGRELIAAARTDRAAARPAFLERFAEYARDPQSELRFVDDLIARTPLDELPLDARNMADPHHRAVFGASFAEGARQGAVGLADDVIAMVLPWGFSTTEITVPTTIWWGEHDGLVPRFHSEYLAGSIPNARLRILPDAAHGLAETHWDAVLEDLLG